MALVELPAVDKPISAKIGIIYPPPEVRNIVDKTASFVARNGPDFESRIRQNEINNPKFNFLNPNDPYHAYYEHKVREFAEGKISETAGMKLTTPSAARLGQETPKAIQETFIPKEPPAEFEFVYDPPSINALDIDIIKLTAQFVARNGRQFLTQLMNREQRNYQFDFLRAQHSMFGYFTKLVEQYTKILIPPKGIASKLDEELFHPKRLLDDVKYRVEWQKYQERQRKREEEAAERERVAYALIDWHDFVVVETVDFQLNEAGNFPVPTTADEVNARMLDEERGMHIHNKVQTSQLPPPPGSLGLMPTDLDEDVGEEDDDADYDDDDVGRESEEEQEAQQPKEQPGSTESRTEIASIDNSTAESIPVKISSPQPPPYASEEVEFAEGDDMELSDDEDVAQSSKQPPKNVLPTNDQVIIRHGYDPKAARQTQTSDSSVVLVSPFTGEKIAPNQASKHMRVGLLDPKWVEQRDREIREKRDQDQVFAAGNLIDNSLKKLAERRTDIFGVGSDEIQIGKKLGESDVVKCDKIIWDGHAASADLVTKRTFQSITAKDKLDLLEFQQNLEAERDKIGPTTTTATPTFNFSKPGVMILTQPPPPPPGSSVTQPPPPGMMMMTNAPPPPVFPPTGMSMPPPPGLGGLPSFMPPLRPLGAMSAPPPPGIMPAPPPPGIMLAPPPPGAMPAPPPPGAMPAPPPPPPPTAEGEPEAKKPRE